MNKNNPFNLANYPRRQTKYFGKKKYTLVDTYTNKAKLDKYRSLWKDGYHFVRTTKKGNKYCLWIKSK